VSEDIAPEIVLALEIDDPALADRLAALLGNIAGLRLAEPGEKAAGRLSLAIRASCLRTLR
jgi:hypothetical protein